MTSMNMKSLALAVFCLCLWDVSAERRPFESYEEIINRQMFGPLPADFDPSKLPSEVQKTPSRDEQLLKKEQEKLQSAIHFSVINVASDGTPTVGFTDNSDPKSPRHYYLKVGESRDGWEVKEADAATATMTIAKGEIEVSLKLGGNSAKDGGTSRVGGVGGPPAASAPVAHRGLLGTGASLGAQRRQRRERERQEQEKREAAAAEREAAREAERQAQAEADKAQRDAERAEQRRQLLEIQEQLRRVREEKAAAKTAENREAENAENATE